MKKQRVCPVFLAVLDFHIEVIKMGVINRWIILE
jgi:hypothetical protein